MSASAQTPVPIRELKGQGPMYVVGIAHGATHWLLGMLYILVPVLREDLGLSYTQAGLLLSIMHVSSLASNLIGGALVGTFLGVFLAYGLVGPFANRMKEVIDEESAFYRIIQAVLVAHLHGNAAQISVEIGRGHVPTTSQPSFLELEDALNNIPTEA